MNQDTQLNHHLWWLYKSLSSHFDSKTYPQIIEKPLNTDIIKDIDDLVAYIKLNY